MAPSDSVTSYLEELHRVIGFRDSTDVGPLADMYHAKDYLKLCRAIGAQMKLSNEIVLAEARPGTPFRTHALSPTDAAGRGTQGIVAQVTIPESLPIYGTPAFTSHVIRITLGDDFGKVPAETAIAVLAHELSHILLYSLRHRDRDSEQCTDLVPVALGFSAIVRGGRVVTTSTTAGNVTTTNKTTYGYLSDAEFDEAAGIVRSALAKWQSDKVALSGILKRGRRAAERARFHLERGRRLLLALDQTRHSVRTSDGSSIVAMHAPAYFDDKEKAVDGVLRSWFGGIPDLLRTTQYTAAMAAELADATEKGERGLLALSRLQSDARSTVRILARNQPFLNRAAEWIRSGWR